MAAELVRRQVTVIAVNSSAMLPAKAATASIPIVFTTSLDPVQLGLVVSLNRPGGNVTGITSLGVEVGPKRLELLHELVPTANVIGLLVNPHNPSAQTLFGSYPGCGPQTWAAAPCFGCQQLARLLQGFRSVSPTAGRRACNRN